MERAYDEARQSVSTACNKTTMLSRDAAGLHMGKKKTQFLKLTFDLLPLSPQIVLPVGIKAVG